MTNVQNGLKVITATEKLKSGQNISKDRSSDNDNASGGIGDPNHIELLMKCFEIKNFRDVLIKRQFDGSYANLHWH